MDDDASDLGDADELIPVDDVPVHVLPRDVEWQAVFVGVRFNIDNSDDFVAYVLQRNAGHSLARVVLTTDGVKLYATDALAPAELQSVGRDATSRVKHPEFTMSADQQTCALGLDDGTVVSAACKPAGDLRASDAELVRSLHEPYAAQLLRLQAWRAEVNARLAVINKTAGTINSLLAV